jgi:hypothetical protein
MTVDPQPAVFRRPAGVAFVEDPLDGDAKAYLARLPDGPIIVLHGTAVTIWREAVAPSGAGSLAARVADYYGVSAEAVEPDVAACLADFIDRGLVEPDGQA